MSGLYVILNFEDPKESQGGAAKNTQQALTAKWKSKDMANDIVEHRCIKNQNGMPALVDGNDLTQMRADCLESKKVYLVMHGDPTDSKHAYANRFDEGEGLLLVGDYKKIADFVLQVLPSRGNSYTVGLIMCFGAKPEKSNVDRIYGKKKVFKSELSTSFAYRLFKKLCLERSLRMTAVTREIYHKDNKSYVTNEVLLDDTIEKIDAHKKIIKSQNKLDPELNVKYVRYMKSNREETRTKIDQYKKNNQLPAKDDLEIFAKKYATWETSDDGETYNILHKLALERYENTITNRIVMFNKQYNVQLTKYGKYVYTFQSDTLKIVNKYEQHLRGLKANKVLYEGPLL